MDNFNKVISFVLGLVVVVVLLVILTGRFNLGSKFLPLANNQKKVTPTPTPKKQVSPTARPSENGQVNGTETYEYHSYNGGSYNGQTTTKGGETTTQSGKTIATIPNTGAPTLLLPFALSSLAGGFFLRRKK